MKKAYFQYYETFENIAQKFKNEKDREYFRRLIIRYGLYGEEPESLSETMDMAFTVIRELIDDQVRRREVNAENRRLKILEGQIQAPELPKVKETKKFQKPTVFDISVYCGERNNGIDAQSFYDFYESKGWKVGNAPMKDWKACVRTWEQRNGQKGNTLPTDRMTL